MLTENKMILLARGILNGGYITVEEARSVYANHEAAHSALQSLTAWGFIKSTDVPGIFRVRKAPPESHAMANNMIAAEKNS